jgi:hypothetical protein
LHLSDEDEASEEKKKELTVSQEIQADLIEATEHSHEKPKNNFPESPSKNKKRKFLESEENPLHKQQRLMVQSWTSPVKRKLSSEFDEVRSIDNDYFSPVKATKK